MLDQRTQTVIATLNPKAQPMFSKFSDLAQIEAARLGCEYKAISGNRSWREQDELYAQGRTKPGRIVTKAKGGYSNHNFGIAADFGVFKDGRYLDETNPTLAEKVHKACATHAAECGLEWGGSWESFPDIPHYQVKTGMGIGALRQKFAMFGSVLD